MSKIWFTSDTHFKSERTLQLSKRPFDSVMEMDNTIINNWNSLIDKNDTVYHLGDFGKYDYIKELNGTVILICGNYEITDIIGKFNSNCEKFKDTLLKLGFRDVKIKGYDYNFDYYSEWISENDKKWSLNMSHKPSELPNVFALNQFNLFGHIHGLQKVKKRGLNVGIDAHNYEPIDVDTVIFYHEAIRKFYDNDVFIQ